MDFIRKFKSMIGQQINDADTEIIFQSLAKNQVPHVEHDAYIEPKRISLIRAREFDQLRSLLTKNGLSSNSQITNAPLGKHRMNKMHDPAKTLKKIDEIEDEMSKLWWKTIRLDFSKGMEDQDRQK
ncbi:MAG TPA: hypothetical protein PKC80_04195 [Burkholderiaceae bacterium]|nr:hypothetical protein [Burkholderiaceae bacterium]